MTAFYSKTCDNPLNRSIPISTLEAEALYGTLLEGDNPLNRSIPISTGKFENLTNERELK